MFLATSRPTNSRRSKQPWRAINEPERSPSSISIRSSRRRVNAWRAQKKTADPAPELAREAEIAELIQRFLATPKPDVATFEAALRAVLFQKASEVLGWVLQQAVVGLEMAYQPRPGEVYKGRIERQVEGLFGPVRLRRDYYHNPETGSGHHPADEALGLEAGYTPGLARILCHVGSEEGSYQAAEACLQEVGGVKVSARQIQRMVERIGPEASLWQKQPAPAETTTAKVLYISGDGTGIPVCKRELEGVSGRPADGPAKTRQVYLGCVFTQHQVDEQGSPVRDLNSTTYVTTMEPVSVFGPLLRQEALRRGLGQTPEVVYLIDGAVGLGALGTLNFTTALQIVDCYHAFLHAGEVVEALLGSRTPAEYASRLRRWKRRLLRNGVKGLIAESLAEAVQLGRVDAVKAKLHYFEENVDRMQYGTFRRQGYFIGSGVVEAGCKTVVGQRCKQSGMFWSRPGASNVLSLRCIQRSRRGDDFWRYRRNELAKGFDTLPLVATGGV